MKIDYAWSLRALNLQSTPKDVDVTDAASAKAAAGDQLATIRDEFIAELRGLGCSETNAMRRIELGLSTMMTNAVGDAGRDTWSATRMRFQRARHSVR